MLRLVTAGPAKLEPADNAMVRFSREYLSVPRKNGGSLFGGLLLAVYAGHGRKNAIWAHAAADISPFDQVVAEVQKRFSDGQLLRKPSYFDAFSPSFVLQTTLVSIGEPFHMEFQKSMAKFMEIVAVGDDEIRRTGASPTSFIDWEVVACDTVWLTAKTVAKTLLHNVVAITLWGICKEDVLAKLFKQIPKSAVRKVCHG
jgi:hypothetical protein